MSVICKETKLSEKRPRKKTVRPTPFIERDIALRNRVAKLDAKQLRGLKLWSELDFFALFGVKPWCQEKDEFLKRVQEELEEEFLEQVTAELKYYALFKLACWQESPSRITLSGRDAIKACDYLLRGLEGLEGIPASVKSLVLTAAGISEPTVSVLERGKVQIERSKRLERARVQIERLERQTINHRPKKITQLLLNHAYTLRSIAILFARPQPDHWLRKVLEIAGINFENRMWRTFIKDLPSIASQTKQIVGDKQ